MVLLRAQVREREAGIDQLLAPIKDMYALLVRYEVRCPQALHLICSAAAQHACKKSSVGFALKSWDGAGARG